MSLSEVIQAELEDMESTGYQTKRWQDLDYKMEKGGSGSNPQSQASVCTLPVSPRSGTCT